MALYRIGIRNEKGNVELYEANYPEGTELETVQTHVGESFPKARPILVLLPPPLPPLQRA